MKKCKNIECNSEFEGKKVYCSLTCRNVYVNKHLRDYSRNSAGLSREEEYYNSPKKCLECNSVIQYKQRINDYCSHSCCAKFNNVGRVQTKNTKEKLSKSLKEFYKDDLLKINCKNCDKEIEKSKKIKFCCLSCKKEYQRRNMTEFQKYKRNCLFSFNLSDFKNEFDFELIKKHGWYKPKNRGNNLNGVSRDHMYSVREGFDNKIEPYLISHPANCKLVLQKENSSKYKNSSITIDELKIRIEIWNKKYKIID